MNFKLRRPRRRTIALLGATLVAASGVGVATADDISNNLDASIDTVAENMPLNSGGTSATTQLYVSPANGDGKQGCNLTGSSTLVVSITSSDLSVASVDPSSATFTSCGDIKTLTVTPGTVLVESTATISVSQTSNSTGGTFNFAPATFTVTVAPSAAPANTAPTVTVDGVTAGTSYNKGAVPAATCTVLDAEDGPSSFPATLSTITGTYASDGIGSQEASCSYTDRGGLTASASKTYSIVDPTAPAISYVLDPASADGANGWYKSDVSLDWTVSEPEPPNSLQETGCVDQLVTADQAETTYSCSASSAGGSATQQNVKIKRDATAPTNIAFNSDVAADGGSYFPTTVPTGTGCTADDVTSGFASCAVTGRSTAVGTHTLTATATDNAGNTSTATRSYSVRVFALSGFFAPVDMGNTVNTVKNGATVPLKFTVEDEGVAQTSTTVVNSFTTREVNCAAMNTNVSDDIEITTSGQTVLRYDAAAGQFIQNYQTAKRAGTCWIATVGFVDGSSISANFKLK